MSSKDPLDAAIEQEMSREQTLVVLARVLALFVGVAVWVSWWLALASAAALMACWFMWHRCDLRLTRLVSVSKEEHDKSGRS
jgi:hypothetical protein